MIVFADTYALFAWLNPNDHAHLKVVKYLDGFVGQLVTTEWVLMELADALSAPPARATVIKFLEAVRGDSLFNVVGYDPHDYQAGFELFAGRSDKA